MAETIGAQNSTSHGKLNTTIKALYGQVDKSVQVVPQLDGVHDEYDDMFHYQGVASEDYNTPSEHGKILT